MPTSTLPPTPTGAPKDWLIPVTYIVPFVFIYTMIKKGAESNYVWHAKNGAGYTAIAIVLNIIFQILWGALSSSLGFLYTIFNLVDLALVLLMFYGAWQAWEGKLPMLPVVTKVGQMLPLEKWFKGGEAAVVTPIAPVVEPTPAPSEPTPAVEPTPTPEPEPTMPEPTPAAPTEPTPPEPTPPQI